MMTVGIMPANAAPPRLVISPKGIEVFPGHNLSPGARAAKQSGKKEGQTVVLVRVKAETYLVAI